MLDRLSNGWVPSALTRRDLVRRVGMLGAGLAGVALVEPGRVAARADDAATRRAELAEVDAKELVKLMRDRTFSGGNVDAVIEALTRAGIGVYEGPIAPSPILPVGDGASPIRLLRWQARNLALELSARGGQLGADLDGLLPAEGMPPVSYLLGAYVATDETPGGEIARALMGKRDWRKAPEVSFPMIVPTLFAATVAREAQIAAVGSRNFARVPVLATGCTTMADFIEQTVRDALLSILDGRDGTIGNTPKDYLAFLQTLETSDLENSLSTDEKQFLSYMYDAAGVLAVTTQVVATVRAWSVRVEPDPTKTRFGIGSERIDGAIVARVDLGDFKEWPADVLECAGAAGLALPPLKAAGSTIEWEVAEKPIPLIEYGDLPGTLDADERATVQYVTYSEDPEVAAGEAKTGKVSIKATVTRDDIEQSRKVLMDAFYAKLWKIPVPLWGNIDDRAPQLWDRLHELTKAHGQGAVSVVYHEEKKKPKKPAAKTERGLVGVWEMEDMGNLMTALLNSDDGPPMSYAGQEGSLTYNLSADGTLLIGAGEFAVGGYADGEIGSVNVTIFLEGDANGTWSADAQTLNLNAIDYAGLEAIFSFVLNGQEMNRTGLDGAERFLPKGSMGYALDSGKLLLFPQPGLPALVLKRIG